MQIFGHRSNQNWYKVLLRFTLMSFICVPSFRLTGVCIHVLWLNLTSVKNGKDDRAGAYSLVGLTFAKPLSATCVRRSRYSNRAVSTILLWNNQWPIMA